MSIALKSRQKTHAKNTEDEQYRAEQKQKVHSRRVSNRVRKRANPVETFTQHIQKSPIYACVSYVRHLYRQSVVEFVQSIYKPAAQDILIIMVIAFDRPNGD